MIEILGVSKVFRVGTKQVHPLRNVTLDVREGEFFVLLGPSGSGKSTLLRCVSGLEEPDEGEILLDGRVVFSKSKGIVLDPADRGIGMVFQSYAIWPHLSVLDNVTLPLIRGKKRMPRRLAVEKGREVLKLVQMDTLMERPASLLSGGQQQRVAVARALSIEPKVLLMDEPLSNLDARMREEVREEIKNLTRQIGITVLYITHDQIEAMALASRIAVLVNGEVKQVALPREVYKKPASHEVATLLGTINWLSGRVIRDGVVETPIGEVRIGTEGLRNNDKILLGIRLEHLCVASTGAAVENEFPAEVISQTFLGDQIWYHLRVGSTRMVWKTFADVDLPKTVYARLPKEKILVFGEG